MQQRLAHLHRATARCQPHKRLAADHQHQGQQTARIERHVVGIKLDQRLPDLDPLAFLDQTGEALASQVHRVQANMHQHLHAVVAGDADRMPGVLDIADHPGQRRAQGLRGGIDAQAVADHAAGEHRVRHLVQRQQHPGQGRQQFQGLSCGHDFTCCFVL